MNNQAESDGPQVMIEPHEAERKMRNRAMDVFDAFLDLPSAVRIQDLNVAIHDYQHAWMVGRKRVTIHG
jgi:hypothetical protein